MWKVQNIYISFNIRTANSSSWARKCQWKTWSFVTKVKVFGSFWPQYLATVGFDLLQKRITCYASKHTLEILLTFFTLKDVGWFKIFNDNFSNKNVNFAFFPRFVLLRVHILLFILFTYYLSIHITNTEK